MGEPQTGAFAVLRRRTQLPKFSRPPKSRKSLQGRPQKPGPIAYVDSDKLEFSEEVSEGFMRRGGLAGEIVEEERGEEPPEDGSEKHIPGPRRRAVACQI